MCRLHAFWSFAVKSGKVIVFVIVNDKGGGVKTSSSGRGGRGKVEFFGGGGGGCRVAFSSGWDESLNFETCVELSSPTRLKGTDSLLTGKRKSLSAFDEKRHK
jgi:hypothetical protein